MAVIVAGGDSDSAGLDSVEILTEDESGNYETRQVHYVRNKIEQNLLNV